VSNSTAAHKPSDLEAKYTGETRTANGYQYWTTSQEDEEALDIREQVASGDYKKKKKKKKRKPLLAKGFMRRTIMRLATMVLLAAVAALLYFGFNYFEVTGATDQASTEEAGAIVVLGAAQYNGSPSNVLQERLDHAYNLWSDGVAPLIMTTGSGADGDVTTEGLVGLEHLLGKGVPEDAILLIPEGTNSWEQLSASAYQMEQRELENVLLVSDEYHTYRLLQIADELGINADVSPSAIVPTQINYMREAAAVSIGRVTGYRRLSGITED